MANKLLANESHAAEEAALDARFAELDAEIGKATSVIRSKQDDKSIMDDLGDKFREIIDRAMCMSSRASLRLHKIGMPCLRLLSESTSSCNRESFGCTVTPRPLA
jgi:hypothetical protein